MNGDAKVVHSTSLQRRIVLWGLLRTAVVIKGILSGRLFFTKLIYFMANFNLYITMSLRTLIFLTGVTDLPVFDPFLRSY